MNDTIGNRLSVAAIASKKQTNFPTTALAGSGGPGCLRSDAGNDLAAPSHELADTRAQVVVRIRDDRVFYTDPRAARIRPAPPPRRHGKRLGCADDPSGWPEQDQQLTGTDCRSGTVTVHAWSGCTPGVGRHGRWARDDQASSPSPRPGRAPAQTDLTFITESDMSFE